LLNDLQKDTYFTYIRNVKKSIELFREENIPLQAEISVLQQQYGQITGAMTVDVNSEQYTLQQAAKFLENSDRKIRESVYHKIQERRLQDKGSLNNLFDKDFLLENGLLPPIVTPSSK
jgi:oligoendopeptidase F